MMVYGRHHLILFPLITKGVVMEYSELKEQTWIYFDNKYHLGHFEDIIFSEVHIDH